MRRVLLFRIWDEGPAGRRMSNCKLVVGLPFGLMAGLIYGGWFASVGGHPPLETLAWSSTAFTLFMYMQARLEPVARHVFSVHRWGWLDASFDLLWDATASGLAGVLVVRQLGAPVLSAVAIASGVGAVYAFGLGFLFCGKGLEGVITMVLARRSGPSSWRPDFSYPRALAAQGHVDAAASYYRKSLVQAPKDPAPYFLLAQLFREAKRLEEAAEMMREACQSGLLKPQQELLVIREISDIYVNKLDTPRRLAPELARYLDRAEEGPAREWAERELREIKAAIAHEMGREPEEEEEEEE